jgi:DNA polymerase I-like protein with 3'-5' exonuclease and polymerase domains
MRLAGIHPEKCRIENVYPFYPEGGSIDQLDSAVVYQWQENALERLRVCTQATVVVCIGNIALETCSGFRDITRRRGSVYEWEGRKVLGMIHPAAILHSRGRGQGQYFEKMCRFDWERVKLLSTPHDAHHVSCGCAAQRKRTHLTPYNTDSHAFISRVKQYRVWGQYPGYVMAIDIETPKVEGKRAIVCVSFAFSPEESIVFPFTAEWKPSIRALCDTACPKVGHNFASFDRWWLEREGIAVRGEIRDSLCMHHCVDPVSPHSLEFLTSRYTWEPFYKSEAHGHDENVVLSSQEAFQHYLEYCGLDSCVTIEIHNILWRELERQGLLDFYRRHYEALYDPILDVMSRGVNIDHPYRTQVLEELLQEAHACRDRLGEINGSPLWSLNTQRDQAIYNAVEKGEHLDRWSEEDIALTLQKVGKKTVSNAQLKTLLYDKLGLPLQTRRRKGSTETPTADAVALRTLRLQYGGTPHVVEVLDAAMRHNKVQKLATFLYPNTFDPADGRFRFTLKLNTEAARLASAAAPDGNGRNSQNTPRDDKRIRRVILPEQGHVIVEADCSQVESRIVFVRTKDPKLIELGRARIGFDQHAFTASMVFKKPIEHVGKGTQERQVAKSISHAAQRAMQGKTMADWMMKNGMVHEDMTPYDEEECDTLLAAYYKAFPGILLWQQRIRREIGRAVV